MTRKIILISGLSGAGLKSVINIFEDHGVDCVDNLPTKMLVSAAELIDKRTPDTEKPIGFALRPRSMNDIHEILTSISQLEDIFRVDHLFVTAQTEVIVHRYKTNRRKHPLQVDESLSLEDAIQRETSLLEPVAAIASVTLDTSTWALQQLAQTIENRYSRSFRLRKLNLEIVSFGFKYGVPGQIDGLYDVRFLHNPYFNIKLRSGTGLQKEVQDYVMSDTRAQQMIHMLYSWLNWVLPNVYEEGRRHYRLAVGCTGGQHRSVTIVEQLYQMVQHMSLKYQVSKVHIHLSRATQAVSTL